MILLAVRYKPVSRALLLVDKVMSTSMTTLSPDLQAIPIIQNEAPNRFLRQQPHRAQECH
jgi:hypothetical protein